MNRKYIDNFGSFSLEAAIVLPIFMLLLLFFYGILILFSGQQLMEHALLQETQSLSLDSYGTEHYGESNLDTAKNMVNKLYSSFSSTNISSQDYFASSVKWHESGGVAEMAKKRFLAYFSGGDEDRAASLLSIVGVENGIDGVDFSGSYIDDDDNLHVIISYEQKFLFDFNGAISFNRNMEAIAHMW